MSTMNQAPVHHWQSLATIFLRTVVLLCSILPPAVSVSCREAILLSDKNNDAMLNRYPEYVTYLSHISTQALSTWKGGFGELPSLLQENYNRFASDSGEINVTFATKSSGDSSSGEMDNFCKTTLQLVAAITSAGQREDQSAVKVMSSDLSTELPWEFALVGSPEPSSTEGYKQRTFADPDERGIGETTSVSGSSHQYTTIALPPLAFLSLRARQLTSVECSVYISSSDLDGDGSLIQQEYVLLVNSIGNADVARSFPELPQSLREAFFKLAKDTDRIILVDDTSRRPSNIFGHSKKRPDVPNGVAADKLCNEIQASLDMHAAGESDAVTTSMDPTLYATQSWTEAPSVTPTSAFSMLDTVTDTDAGTEESTSETLLLDTPLPLDSLRAPETEVATAVEGTPTQELISLTQDISLPNVPSGEDQNENPNIPPEQEQQTPNFPNFPPEQDQNEDPSIPPGQDQDETPNIPPGQDQDETPNIPPGQDQNETPTIPLGQDQNENPTILPGQNQNETMVPSYTTADPQSTSPPEPERPSDQSSLLPVYNSWIMSNTLGFTSDDILRSRNFNGLSSAYESFARDIVSEMTAARLSQTRQLGQGRDLAVTLPREPAIIYDIVDDECRLSVTPNSMCVRVFGQVDLEIDGNEVAIAVFNEYVDLSQSRIDEGLLQRKLNEASPGSVWMVEESSSPLLPSDLELENSADEDGGRLTLDLKGGLILSAAVTVAVMVLVCLFVVLPAKRKQKRIADEEKQALAELNEAEALNEALTAVNQKKRVPVGGPKKKHDEKTNPYRIRIARALDQYCPERKKDLDSLLHQFRGREEELLAILKDTKMEESVWSEDSSSEEAEVWESDSVSSESIQDLSESVGQEMPMDSNEMSNKEEDDGGSAPDLDEVVDHVEARSATVLEPHGLNMVDDEDEEMERLAREEAEKAAAAERERLEQEAAAERERLEREAAERERLEREAAERIRLEREAAAERERLEREAAEKAVAEEMERLRQIAREEDEAKKKAEEAMAAAEAARVKAEEEARLALEARMRAEDARRTLDMPLPKKTEISTEEDTALETMDSDWDSSSDESGMYRVHWFKQNGHWKAKKIAVMDYDDLSEDYYDSDDETLSTMHPRWRWVKDGAKWVKQYFSDDENDSDESYESDSNSDEDSQNLWVKRNGKWIQVQMGGVPNDDGSLAYSTDTHRPEGGPAERGRSSMGFLLGAS